MAILNFGSLNIDIVFEVDDIVKPGETKTALTSKVECGGKGLNQSIALTFAGAKVFHAGKIGKDGRNLLKKLNSLGIDTSYIYSVDRSNGFAVVQVDKKGENSIICSGGTNHEITKEEINAVLSHFGKNDYLLLQNELNLTDYIIKKANERGIKIAINLAPFTEETKNYPLELTDYLIINETEGQNLTGETDEIKIVEKLSKLYNETAIVLTRGKNGCIIKKGDKVTPIAAYDVKAVDTTGAGDVFTGYFLAEIIKGKTEEAAADIASKAAAISVTKKGTSNSIPTMDEVKSANLELSKQK